MRHARGKLSSNEPAFAIPARLTSIALRVQALFQKYVEGNLLVDALEAEREFVMTPKMFMHNINRICLSNVRPSQLNVFAMPRSPAFIVIAAEASGNSIELSPCCRGQTCISVVQMASGM